MIKLADSYAMALPDVVEQPHFQLPGFQVADKLLAHLDDVPWVLWSRVAGLSC